MDAEQLMQQMWNTWKPYNRAQDDKWRSYIVSSLEAETLEAEDTCVTLVNGNEGIYCA